MTAAAVSVADRRLHLVVGKGGVGKTTVSAALARCLARRGRRVLAVEMDVAGRLPAMLGVSGAPRDPVEAAPNLFVGSVDGRSALEEYLALIVPVRRLLHTVFQNRIYQYFVAAAPGLKELMTVGKIWYETTREERGRPVWDAVVVDAPATGHGLQYLRMPRAARDTFGAGLVQREAARVTALLEDAAVTAVHLVTLAEEMPVTEALEAATTLREQLAMPLGWVVVNRLHRRRFAPATLDKLEASSRHADAADVPLLRCVLERAREEQGWSAINAHYLQRLRDTLGATAPMVELPYLFVEEFDAHALGTLSDIVDDAIGAEGRAARARGGR